MSASTQKYWMLVASKNHVQRAIEEGIAQACHGKAYPLKRMNVGDGIIYYSSKLEYQEPASCQAFTAMGRVVGETVYQHDMGNGFVPYRRDIEYVNANAVDIKPLIEQLHFIKDKRRWGYPFRFGAFGISQVDFELIANAMEIKK